MAGLRYSLPLKTDDAIRMRKKRTA